MKRILVVGAGCTGSCVAAHLRKSLGKHVSIDVWEWSRGVGGRMTSTRHESASETLRADTGASMISADMSDEASAVLVKSLVQADILRQVDSLLLSGTPLRPRGGSWQHFASVSGGLNSALKFLLEEANVTTSFERRVAAIDPHGRLWKVRPYEGPTEMFDAVVIAVEACGDGTDHVHQIKGGWQRLIDPATDRLLRRELYDHRFGVALFLRPEYKEHCEAFFGPSVFEREVDDDMTHLMQYQSRKTAVIGGVPSSGVVVVAHCTLQYSNRDLGIGKNRRLDFITNRIIYQYLVVPEHVKVANVIMGSKVINWRTCEVVTPLVGPSAAYPNCLPVSQQPPLVLGGDYFTQSNFTGCVASARDAAAAVAAALQAEHVLSKSDADAFGPAVHTGNDTRIASAPPARRWSSKLASDATDVVSAASDHIVSSQEADFVGAVSDERREGRWKGRSGGKGRSKGKESKAYGGISQER